MTKFAKIAKIVVFANFKRLRAAHAFFVQISNLSNVRLLQDAVFAYSEKQGNHGTQLESLNFSSGGGIGCSNYMEQ